MLFLVDCCHYLFQDLNEHVNEKCKTTHGNREPEVSIIHVCINGSGSACNVLQSVLCCCIFLKPLFQFVFFVHDFSRSSSALMMSVSMMPLNKVG